MKVNKLTKGALAMVVGTALLLGGAGTFAYWSESVQVGGGTITAGDLNLETKGTGTWTDHTGTVIPDITKYKMVPGDSLTYTQELDVTLVGDKIAAKVTVTQPDTIQSASDPSTKQPAFDPSKNSFRNVPGPSFGSLIVEPVTLKDQSNNQPVLATEQSPLRASKKGLIASTTFKFPSTVTGREDVNETYDFGKVAFKLEQITQSGLA